MASIAPSAKEVLERKMAQYCRFSDTNKWDEFVKLFLPDAPMVFNDVHGIGWYNVGPYNRFESVAPLAEFMKQNSGSQQSLHMVGPGEFEQVDEDTIKSIFAVTYQVGDIGTTDGKHAVGGGHYSLTWKRKDGDWFIADYRVDRLYYKAMTI